MTTTPAPMDEKRARALIADYNRELSDAFQTGQRVRPHDHLEREAVGYLQALEDERKRSKDLVEAAKAIGNFEPHDANTGYCYFCTERDSRGVHDEKCPWPGFNAALKDYEGRTLGEKV